MRKAYADFPGLVLRKVLLCATGVLVWGAMVATPVSAPAEENMTGPALQAVPNRQVQQTTSEGKPELPEMPDSSDDASQVRENASGGEHPADNGNGATPEKPPRLPDAGKLKQHDRENSTGNHKADGEAKVVGHRLAPGIMVLLEQEMRNGLKKRRIESHFSRFKRYLGWKLDTTASDYTGNEVTGLCRLKWYDHLLRHPESATAEAEQFTRQLHTALQDEHLGAATLVHLIRPKMDAPAGNMPVAAAANSAEQALECVEHALKQCRQRYEKALEPLSASQLRQLQYYAYRVFVAQATNGHTLPDRSTATYMCRAMNKMDADALFAAPEALLPLADVDLLDRLAELYAEPAPEAPAAVSGVTGAVRAVRKTDAGTIVIGGPDDNTYQLDEMEDLVAVIDLGGNDTYLEGSVSAKRPLLVLIDLDGNDKYRGVRPGIQGGAILGVSMLLDLKGNDVYQARDVAQASAIAGAGILIDYDGNDVYAGVRRVQSQALGGLALLIDRNGNDRYHAALWAQGLGAPLGCAVLDDLAGDDHYFVGGLYPDSYEETPGYDGWGQGVGNGLRQVANGGIGVLLDGGGDDVYEFDYMAHGGGYWLGVGFARDFAGNDRRLGATTMTFRGGRRTERRFQRFGCGFGCHYALGFCFDDQGNDSYGGTIMGLGYAWDCGVGALCDFGGDDRYEATGGGTQGSSGQASLGILFDYDGDDVYSGTSQGYASSNISYHQLPACGGNFSFLIDYGGDDKYGCRVRNNTYNQRGAAGGFLIDRPRRTESDGK